MGSCWYLEHVTTRDRIVLNKGENLLGRHSTCKITIKEPYDFVSRVHVKMTVSDAGVLVQSMNTSNGVFINEQKMKDQTTSTHVVAGTVISLGVEGHIVNAPRNYPIFVLRKVVPKAEEEIVLSSDDDDDDNARPLQKCNPGQLIIDLSSIKKDTSEQENHPSSSNLHLPKIPDVKREMVHKTTEEITEIFGTADEAILGSVMDINPYLYNQLNKQSAGGVASTNAKIHDGDVIELDTDADKEAMSLPPSKPLEAADNDEYDEQFAISQAVLQGMKAEMAFSDGEEDFLSSNVMEDEALLGSPSNQGNFDDIIIISESEDDELYDKVADWSNKLLSQKPDPDPIEVSLVKDSGGTDQEIDSRFGMKKAPRSLFIDISSEDEESNSLDSLSIVNSTTTSPPGSRCPQHFAREVSCSTDDSQLFSRRPRVVSESDQENRVPDSTSKSHELPGTEPKCSLPEPICPTEYKKDTFSEEEEAPKLTSARMRNRSKSFYMERPIDADVTLETKDLNEKRSEPIEEVEDCREELLVTLHASEEQKQNEPLTRHKATHSSKEDDLMAKASQQNGRRISPRKRVQDEAASTAQTQAKQRSARLLNRSRSCYVERPIEMDEFQETNEDVQEKQNDPPTRKRPKSIEKKPKTPPKKSEGNKANRTKNSHEEIEERAEKPKNNRDSVAPRKGDTASAAQENERRISPRKRVQDEPVSTAQTQAKNRSARLLNRSRSCYVERPNDMDDEFQESKQTNEEVKEKQNDPPTRKRPKSIEKDCDDSKKKQKTPPKKSEGKHSNKTNKTHEEIEERAEIPKNNRESDTPRKGSSPASAAQENGPRISPRKHVQDEAATAPQTQTKNRSARLLNRSRSCYVERPIDMDDEFQESKQTNEDVNEKQNDPPNKKRPKSIEKKPKKSEGKHSNKTKNSHEEIEERAVIPKINRDSVTPRKEDTQGKKGPSPRLQKRSKSEHTDNIVKTNENSLAQSDATTSTKTPKDATRFTRGPSIIEASFMFKNRSKVNNKDKQRDKKKDDEVIKEKRREALKKLSDRTKDEEKNSPSTSNANKRKNCTSVPTVSNTNRGEFLTKEIESGPPTKIAKKVEKPKVQTPPEKNSIPKRRSTIETDDLANYPEPHCSRPPERKEAQQARNQRTCNRVNFADMELYRQRVEDAKKMLKQRRHVHFRDEEDIKYIERVFGANKPVRKNKDSLKICLSTYSERRCWTLQGSNMVNDMLYHKRTILTWANQWLRQGSVDAVAEKDVLKQIPSDFTSLQHYRETFLPLIKLELLTTIERDHKSLKTTLVLEVTDVDFDKEYYRISTKTNNATAVGRFELYTLSSGTELLETFATLLEQKTVGGGVCFMKFEILMQVSFERMKSLKQLTVRPVVDSLRVELGALSAIQQLHRSPLSRRLLMPTEAVKTIPIPKVSQAFTYTGFTKLNQHQEDICVRIYKRVIDNVNPSVTLVQGPPGTGKSILLSNLSLQCLYGKASVMLDRKILICAHSNTAVDNMVRALSKALFAMKHDHFQLLRFGMTEKMSENSRQFSISAHLKRARNEKLKRLTPEHIEMLKKQLSDLMAEIQKLKQNPNIMSPYLQQQLQQNHKQLSLISEQLNPPLTQREEYDIAKICVKRAHIVCTTLSSCVKLANYVDFFDICIIDEATQCTEPWTLLPMRFGIKHLVLVGDTQQLPAVVLSKKAVDFGLGNSMFDRIQRSLMKQLDLDVPGGNQHVHTKLFKLSMQYRMHPEICRWPNKYFYENQLVSADLTAKPSPLIPYCVVNLSYTRDTAGTGGNRSISNDEEARFVAQLLAEMDKHMPSKNFSYGLISPYSNQCHALSQVIPRHMNLTPQTVDSYQGLEKDVIIISNARTRGCGFLAHYQRLNVALTRPKRCLIICGNFDDLQSSDMWRQLLDDARQRKVYFDLKRDDLNDLPGSLMKKLLLKP